MVPLCAALPTKLATEPLAFDSSCCPCEPSFCSSCLRRGHGQGLSLSLSEIFLGADLDSLYFLSCGSVSHRPCCAAAGGEPSGAGSREGDSTRAWMPVRGSARAGESQSGPGHAAACVCSGSGRRCSRSGYIGSPDARMAARRAVTPSATREWIG